MKIEYRLIDEKEKSPLEIQYNDEFEPVIIINMHYKIWLSLMRTTVPGIAESLRNKLSEICDSFLKDMMYMED
tara:strand:- start:2547 stop:2765 length:219 start_codon:yes stop_codon:yes gene_type:complete